MLSFTINYSFISDLQRDYLEDNNPRESEVQIHLLEFRLTSSTITRHRSIQELSASLRFPFRSSPDSVGPPPRPQGEDSPSRRPELAREEGVPHGRPRSSGRCARPGPAGRSLLLKRPPWRRRLRVKPGKVVCSLSTLQGSQGVRGPQGITGPKGVTVSGQRVGSRGGLQAPRGGGAWGSPREMPSFCASVFFTCK